MVGDSESLAERQARGAERHAAATQVQARFRGRRVRERMGDRESLADRTKREQAERVERQARKAAERQTLGAERRAAATQVQARFRGRKVRQARREERSATKIQSMYRGQQVRQRQKAAEASNLQRAKQANARRARLDTADFTRHTNRGGGVRRAAWDPTEPEPEPEPEQPSPAPPASPPPRRRRARPRHATSPAASPVKSPDRAGTETKSRRKKKKGKKKKKKATSPRNAGSVAWADTEGAPSPKPAALAGNALLAKLMGGGGGGGSESATSPQVKNTVEQSVNALSRWRKTRTKVASVAKTITIL